MQFVRVSLALLVVILTPLTSSASIPATYTNNNFWTSEHDTPEQFFRRENGDFYGFTTTGKYFTHTRVVNDRDVRLHRFAIDQAYFYITDRGPISAEDDLMALSIYFATPST